MSAHKSPVCTGAAVLLAILLSACGGGGGGGGGSSSSANAGGNSDPAISADLVAIDVRNAKHLAFAARIVEALAETALTDVPAAATQTMAAVASYGNGGVSDTLDCDGGGTMKVTGSANGATHIGNVTLVYDNCTDDSGISSGTMHIGVRASDAFGTPTALDYRYENYWTQEPERGQDFRYDGSFSVDPDGTGSRFTASLTVTEMRSGESISAVNYIATYAKTSSLTPYQPPQYKTTSRSGRIADSVWGAAEVGVETGNSGRSYLTGLQRSRLRVDESADVDSLHLALDADGDGNYERFAWVPEDELGNVRNPNTAPTVAIQAPQPPEGIDQQITVPLGGVTDAEFDLLRYTITAQQFPGDGAIEQQDDSSFSFRAGARGTYVFLLTIDDGRGGTATQTISIDVKLPSPLVSTPTAIDADVNGGIVATSVQPTNTTAGPFTYRLVSGPTGMTVDNQGNVQWQPARGFFERFEVQGIVAVANADHEVEVPVSLQVRDAGRTPPLMRSVLAQPTTTHNTFVLDFAHDGIQRILTTDNAHLIYTLKLQNGSYVQDWAYPYAPPSGASIDHILPFDANHDGNYEIAVKAGDTLYIIGEDHQSIVRSIALSGRTSGRLVVADIDNDGREELITTVTAGDSMTLQGVVFDAATLVERWRTPPLWLGDDFAVGNVDGDAALELAFSGGFVFDGQTHALQWSNSLNGGFGTGIEIGDIDGDGIGEIIGLSGNFSGTGVTAFSAVSQSSLWTIPADNLGLSSATLMQLDGDPALEIVTGDRFHGLVRAYDATHNSATLKWSETENNGVTDFATGDADNDGNEDLLWSTQGWGGGETALVVFDPQGLARTFSTADEPLRGDFRGGIATTQNGAKRVVFSSRGETNQSSRFAALDPVGGIIDRSAAIANNATFSPSFCALDADNDGSDDVVFGGYDSTHHFLESYSLATQLQQWLHPGATIDRVDIPQACGDFNGDGNSDIAWVSGGNLEIIDATTQATLWSTPLPQYAGSLASADIDGDGDGKAELVVAHFTEIKKYRFNGSGYVEAGTYSGIPAATNIEDRPRVTLVDTDGDHHPEIVVTYTLYAGTGATQLIVLNADLTERSRSVVEERVVSIAPEFIERGRVLATLSGNSYPYTQRAALIDVSTGAWIWRSPQLIGDLTDDSLHYDAIAPNGGSVSIGTSNAMYITR